MPTVWGLSKRKDWLLNSIGSLQFQKKIVFWSQASEPDEKDQGGCGEEQSLEAATLDVEQEEEAGEADENEQDGAGIDDGGPNRAGVAAFVEVVDEGDPAFGELREFVAAVGPLDEDVGAEGGAFEGDEEGVCLDKKLIHQAAQTVLAAQVLDDFETGDFFLRHDGHNPRCKSAWQGGLKLLLLPGAAKHPVRVIEGEAGDAEEEHGGEAEHGAVDVQPAHPGGEALLEAGPTRGGGYGRALHSSRARVISVLEGRSVVKAVPFQSKLCLMTWRVPFSRAASSTRV